MDTRTPDLFMSLFVHGISQIDSWDPTTSSISPPPRPARPSHPRPKRPLPHQPSEHEVLYEMLSDAEMDIYVWASSEDMMEEANVQEGFGLASADCLLGHRLVLEHVWECLEEGHIPDEWEYTPDENIVEVLVDKLDQAMSAHDERVSRWREQVRRIQSAVEEDPAWRRYDEEKAAYPQRLAEWKERVRVAAQRRTGFATKEDAVADYWSRHNYTWAHALLGYMPPRSESTG